MNTNPEEQVQIRVEGCGTWIFRLIWFNNRHHPERKQSADSHGQDEYRLTKGHTGQTPEDLAAELELRPGDQLVFHRVEGAITLEVDRSIPDSIVSGLDAPEQRKKEVQAEINSLLSTPQGSYKWSGDLDDAGRSDLAADRDPKKGHVYVLSNPSMPGICKVGYTTRDPEHRASELFGSGVPEPFVVEGFVCVPFPYRFEKFVHDLWLRDRVHPDREFYTLDPRDAIGYIEKASRNWVKAYD